MELVAGYELNRHGHDHQPDQSGEGQCAHGTAARSAPRTSATTGPVPVGDLTCCDNNANGLQYEKPGDTPARAFVQLYYDLNGNGKVDINGDPLLPW